MVDFYKYLTSHDIYKLNVRAMDTPNFDNLELELGNVKTQLGMEIYQDLVSGFLKLAHNPEAVLDNLWYITQESMHKKFKSVFGEYNEYFCNLFYFYLTGGKEKIKIPLLIFVKKMSPFLHNPKRERK